MIKTLESVRIKIGDKDFVLAFSNRAMFAHLRRITERPDDPEQVVNYYYDLCKAGAVLEGKEFLYTFDEFYDVIDCYPDAISKFADAVTKLIPENGKKK
jgi:hypothetical protein